MSQGLPSGSFELLTKIGKTFTKDSKSVKFLKVEKDHAYKSGLRMKGKRSLVCKTSRVTFTLCKQGIRTVIPSYTHLASHQMLMMDQELCLLTDCDRM